MFRLIIIFLTLFPLWATAQSSTFTVTVEPGEYTIEQALQQARLTRLQGSAQDGSTVLKLQPGIYRLSQPIILRPEDSGTRIIAEGDVRLSGGVVINDWSKQGKLWVADVPLWNGRPLEFRQLWVNGRKAIRARDVSDFEQMHRILGVDKQHEIIYVPRKSVECLGLSVKRHLPKEKSLNTQHSTLNTLEMVLHEMWCVANLRIKDMREQGDSVALTFHQPESHIHFMHPWPSPMVTEDGKHNSAFYLTGARELLDEPGEWWLDMQNRKLYYLPLPDEDMQTAEVVAPALETLLMSEGTPDEPVKDITIEGITFEHSTWLRPSIKGHAPLQAGMFMIEAYKIRPQISRTNGDHKLDNQGWVGHPAAAVAINCAESFSLSDCTFRHMASTALDYHRYVNGGTIDRCTFNDIGGTAILAGSFGPEGHEAHLPYNPSDQREICTNLTISNNRIDDAANEDWGCLGIGAGFVRGIRIEHNEISNVSYTGISLGWGWNRQPCAMADNVVRANYIHHYARHMYDTAGIYTLGAQPNTIIEENVVDSIYSPSYVHDPEHWFYLYTDEGSSGITLRHNWTPSEKYLKNAVGPNNVWEDNGPQVNNSIKARAGVMRGKN